MRLRNSKYESVETECSDQIYKQIKKKTKVYCCCCCCFQCNKDITVDYMQQCQDEPNMAVSFEDIVVVQVNKNQYAFNGKIEFLKTIHEPWKVRIFYRQPDLCCGF